MKIHDMNLFTKMRFFITISLLSPPIHSLKLWPIYSESQNSTKTDDIFLRSVDDIEEYYREPKIDNHGEPKSGTKEHNILFIAVDDFGQKTHSYGEHHMLTPNLDKLASEGI